MVGFFTREEYLKNSDKSLSLKKSIQNYFYLRFNYKIGHPCPKKIILAKFSKHFHTPYYIMKLLITQKNIYLKNNNFPFYSC